MSRSLHRQYARPLLMLLLGVGSVSLRAQTDRQRYTLTKSTVVAALNQNGLLMDASQVDLPSDLISARSEPQLRITRADLLPDSRVRVRLACQRSDDCMPFLATLRFSSAAEGLAALTHLRRSVEVADAPEHSPSHPAVLAGQHATLLMEDGRMRIAFEVISIDSGARGTEVRVSSLDRKQLFHAVVLDGKTVRAKLP